MNRPAGKARTAMWVVLAAALLISAAPFTAEVFAQDQFPPAPVPAGATSQPAPAGALTEDLKHAIIRLPLAAALGMILALRPRHRGAKHRNSMVVQTQIMLSVVGAVIMIIVGGSLARGFAIAGAANLIRYRSTIDDPKEAVVMLCALAAGLAAGVGLYELGIFATIFMAALLWIVEYFEPTARKHFELELSAKETAVLRPKIEDVLAGFNLDFELLAESEDELKYSISSPADVRTRDVSDTIRLVCSGDEVAIEWDEKKTKK